MDLKDFFIPRNPYRAMEIAQEYIDRIREEDKEARADIMAKKIVKIIGEYFFISKMDKKDKAEMLDKIKKVVNK